MCKSRASYVRQNVSFPASGVASALRVFFALSPPTYLTVQQALRPTGVNMIEVCGLAGRMAAKERKERIKQRFFGYLTPSGREDGNAR